MQIAYESICLHVCFAHLCPCLYLWAYLHIHVSFSTLLKHVCNCSIEIIVRMIQNVLQT